MHVVVATQPRFIYRTYTHHDDPFNNDIGLIMVVPGDLVLVEDCGIRVGRGGRTLH